MEIYNKVIFLKLAFTYNTNLIKTYNENRNFIKTA